jgi:uncharacterized protein YwgA
MTNNIYSEEKLNLLLEIIKDINKVNPEKIIGKTFIQKIIFLIGRENIGDFPFTLYHYGPYSDELSDYLSFAEMLNYAKVEWNEYQGYSISILNKKDIKLPYAETSKIEEIINKYHDLSANDISLVATAYYLKDEYKIPDEKIVEEVKKVKPKFSEDYIKKILWECEVV